MIRSNGTPARTLNVFVVEDELDALLQMDRALNRAARTRGCSINVASYRNGWEALRAIARADVHDDLPDFVVADLDMPVMGGMRFLRLIRGELRLADLPFFMVATPGASEDRSGAIAAGADHFFVKPETFREAVALAETMMALSDERSTRRRRERDETLALGSSMSERA